MKTTVKLGLGKAISVEPDGEGIRVTLTALGAPIHVELITPDQAEALHFGIDQVLEVLQLRRERLAA